MAGGSQEYLVATGGVAVVLDASDEEKIASDPRIVSERARQAEDRQRVWMPVDWHSIERGTQR